MTYSRFQLSLLATATLVAGCAPVSEPESINNVPVPTHSSEQAFDVKPIRQGGIFMKRSDAESYHAPVREVDVLKEELVSLKGQLGGLRGDVTVLQNDPVEETIRGIVAESKAEMDVQNALREAQLETEIEDKFIALSSRLEEMKQAELAAVSEDKDKQDEIAARFYSVERELKAMKKRELKDIAEKDLFLVALDEKFAEIEGVMSHVQSSQDMRIADLEERRAMVEEQLLIIAKEDREGRKELERQRLELTTKMAALEADNVLKMKDVEAKLQNRIADMEDRRKILEEQLMIMAREDRDSRQELEAQRNELNAQIASLREEEQQRALDLLGLYESTESKLQDAITSLKAQQQAAAVEDQVRLLDLQKEFEGKLGIVREEQQELTLAQMSRLNGLVKKLKESQDARKEEKIELLEKQISQLKQAQEVQVATVQARDKAFAQAREVRFMEELQLRKLVDEARRKQIMADAKRQSEVENLAKEHMKAEKTRRAQLENQVASLEDTLTVMMEDEAKRLAEEDARRQDMEARLNARLDALKVEYEEKITELQKEKDILSQDLASVQEAGASEKKAWEARRDEIVTELTNLQNEYSEDRKLAEAYRHAIDERIFLAEGLGSQGDGFTPSERENIVVTNEDIDARDIAVSTVELSPASTGSISFGNGQEDWISINDYHVVLHADNQRLKDIVDQVLAQAEPFAGPWRVKWKLEKSNSDVLSEKFSLDVETTFDQFASYLSSYMRSYRGFGLTFNMFEAERVIVITD